MINVTRKQFTGVPFPGIIHQKAQLVNEPARGISFNRPERYLVNTPVGQVEIGHGDWVLELPSGSRYVVRGNDVDQLMEGKKRKWWLW